MKFAIKIVAIAVIIGVAGCASSSREIGKAYVSPKKYKDYTCEELHGEADHISAEVNKLAQSLDREAGKDTAQAAGFTVLGFLTLGVGWLGLATLEGGDGHEAVEYARLKGEFEAIRQMATEKKCRL